MERVILIIIGVRVSYLGGFNSEVQLIFIELEGSAGVKFKLSNPTKDERANEEIQSADRRSTVPD